MNLRKDHYWFFSARASARDKQRSSNKLPVAERLGSSWPYYSGCSVRRQLVCSRLQHCERTGLAVEASRTAGGLVERYGAPVTDRGDITNRSMIYNASLRVKTEPIFLVWKCETCVKFFHTSPLFGEANVYEKDNTTQWITWLEGR